MKYSNIFVALTIAVKTIVAIVLEIKLPNKYKTLRFNLNCRRNIYTFGWLIDCSFFAILLNSTLEPHSQFLISNYYFALLSAIAIGLFIILYLIDKKLVTKYRVYVLNNIVEYNEYKNGERDEAIIASLRPFLTKLSSALVVLLTSVTYLIFGVTNITNQISALERDTSLALISEAEKLSSIHEVLSGVSGVQSVGLMLVMGIVPALLMATSYYLYRKHYILDEDEYRRIVGELEKRKGEAR